MTGVYRAARSLAAKGIPVFPCVPDGKEPLTAHGFQDAADTRDRLRGARGVERMRLARELARHVRLEIQVIDAREGVTMREVLAVIEEAFA